MYAVQRNDSYILRELLARGANEFIENHNGQTAKQLAVLGQKIYAIRTFETWRKRESLVLNDQLLRASEMGDVKTLNKFIKNGADTTVRNDNGDTGLHIAAWKCC